MKTILYSGLTANGNYGSTDGGRMPKQEELDDLFGRAKGAGNIVMGRKTYEIFNDGSTFNGLDVVVVSTVKTFEDARVVGSPSEAINYLKEKGYEKAFVIGGVTLANAFLAENLVDEMYVNIEPYLEEGLQLKPGDGKSQDLKLLGHQEIAKTGIVQLHYGIG